MRRFLLAAAAAVLALAIAGAGTGAPRAAGDFWLGQWGITISAGEQGVLGIDRMSESEALAEWTNRAHQIGPNVKPRKEDCLAYLHATYTWNGGGTWVGCSKHASGVAVVTEDNFLMGLTSDPTGIGEIFVGQNPADRGGISVDHSRSCKATSNATTYSCTTLFTGHRADRVPTGTTKTVNAPVSGGSVAMSSPLLPSDASEGEVTASSSTGELKFNNWVTVEFASENANVEFANGVLFLECWDVTSELAPFFGPGERLRSCISWMRKFYKYDVLVPDRASTSVARAPAGATCMAKRVPLKVQIRKRKVVSVKAVSRPAAKIRFSCSTTNGELHIKLKGAAKGSLRKSLGKKLNLLVVRPKKAPRATGKLNVTFSW